MNVSFGKIRCFNETSALTNEQIRATKIAEKSFDTHPTIPFRYGKDVRTGMELSLSQALEQRKNADVFIICKKNGNIALKVMKPVSGTMDEQGRLRYYVPCESYDNKLKIEVNPKFAYSRLDGIFRKFAQRCQYYLNCGESKINKQAEKNILDKFLKEKEINNVE